MFRSPIQEMGRGKVNYLQRSREDKGDHDGQRTQGDEKTVITMAK
jgi:hypothetical protein